MLILCLAELFWFGPVGVRLGWGADSAFRAGGPRSGRATNSKAGASERSAGVFDGTLE